MRRILKGCPSPLAGDIPASDLEVTLAAREAFYDALADDNARHVLDDLDRSCRPAIDQIDRMRLALAPPALWPDIVAPVRPCVEAWARRHRLDVTWLVEDAIWSLTDAGDTNDPGGGRLRLAPKDLPLRAGESPKLGFGSVNLVFAWRFASQPRGIYRKSMLSSLTNQLDAELDRIEKEAAAKGARKHAHKKNDTSLHFRWLVRYQVLVETYNTIADSEGVERVSVREAVRKTADLTGLRLRDPDPPGRPFDSTQPSG